MILVVFSFNDREFVSFPWEGFTLRWYRTFLDNPEIPSTLWASVQVATLTAVLTTALAIPASTERITVSRTWFGSRSRVGGSSRRGSSRARCWRRS